MHAGLEGLKSQVFGADRCEFVFQLSMAQPSYLRQMTSLSLFPHLENEGYNAPLTEWLQIWDLNLDVQ